MFLFLKWILICWRILTCKSETSLARARESFYRLIFPPFFPSLSQFSLYSFFSPLLSMVAVASLSSKFGVPLTALSVVAQIAPDCPEIWCVVDQDPTQLQNIVTRSRSGGVSIFRFFFLLHFEIQISCCYCCGVLSGRKEKWKRNERKKGGRKIKASVFFFRGWDLV